MRLPDDRETAGGVMAVELLTAVQLLAAIDSRQMRIGTYTVNAIDVTVDDMALLASESMGGPLVNLRRTGQYAERSVLIGQTYSWEQWCLSVTACCAEEAVNTLYWVEENYLMKDELPERLTYMRFRGGCLEKDYLMNLEQPPYAFD